MDKAKFCEPKDVKKIVGGDRGAILEQHVADDKWYIAPTSWSESTYDHVIGPYDTVEDARAAMHLLKLLKAGPQWFQDTEFWRR